MISQVCLLVLISGGAPSDGRSAALALARALDRYQRCAYSAVQHIQAVCPGGVTEVYLLTDAEKNSRRHEVLSPLRYKGMLIVDNGRARQYYSPADGSTQFQPSNLWTEHQLSVQDRAALILANYDLNITRNVSASGRPASRICAKPKRQGALHRDYWLDSKTDTVLKSEFYADNGRCVYRQELMFPKFRDRLPESTFVMKCGTAVKRVMLPRPIPCRTLDELRRRVGFPVVLSQPAPLGMKFAYGEAMRSEGQSVAILRYTDGLALASVYETHSNEPPRAAQSFSGADRAVMFSMGGSKCTIMADLGEHGIRQFVLAFEAAEKALPAAQRPARGSSKQ